MKKTEQKLIEFIEQNSLINKNDKLIVAFSGGPDSVFALYFLNKFKKKYNCDLFAVHFNHQLRGDESDLDEKFAESFCEKLDIPFYAVRLDVKIFADKNKLSIEESARKLRYENLEELCKDYKYDKIVTAHNQSDNTETVLLNVISGTGINGFAGIPIKRGNIVRPLICISKKEILDYLHSNKIGYRVDSSNLNEKFERNFIRNKIVPLLKVNINQSIDSAVFRSSRVIESASKIIEKKVNTLVEKYIAVQNFGLIIDLELFLPKNISLSGEVMRKVLLENYKHEFDFDDSKKILSLVKKQKGKSIQLSSNLTAHREKDKIFVKVFKKNQKIKKIVGAGSYVKVDSKIIGIDEIDKEKIKYQQDGLIEYVDASHLDDKFLLRSWKNGDKFKPLGMDKYKSISDFLTDANIPSFEKKNQLVLINRNNIVWVVGLRIDNRYKITSKTKKIFKLWIQ